MRASLITGHGELDVIEYRENVARPIIGPGDVLVRVAATAVNFHDLFTRRGMPGIKITMPVITGSDIAGAIEEVGDNVENWSPGDRVLIDPLFRAPDPTGLVGETVDGGRAEFVKVRAYQLVPIPDAVSLDDAAALPLAYGTAHRMIVTQGRVKKGERVLILGASGGVGVACVQLCRMAGAEVVVAASTQSKLEKLSALGAEHLINYAEVDVKDAVHQRFGKPKVQGGGGVDVVVNFTGGDTWAKSLRCLRAGGRLLTCGATAGYAVETDLRYVWTFEQHIIGSNGWARQDLTTLLTLIENEHLRPVVETIVPLEDAARAEAMLEERRAFGKILIKP